MTGTTNNAGAYLFTGLVPTEYTVSYVNPSPLMTAVGSFPGIQSWTPAGTSTTTRIITSTLATGANATDYTFGLQKLATLSGRIAVDQNNDRIVDGADYGITSQTVELLSGGVVIATTTTDTFGNYTFTGLLAGNYGIRYTNTSTYTPFWSNIGTVGGSTPSFTEINNIPLALAQNGNGYDFFTTNPSNIVITKTIDGTSNVSSLPGGNHTWLITVRNTGSGTAFNVAVEDIVNTGFVVSTVLASQGSYSTTTNLWTIGNIPAGWSVTLNIFGKISTGYVGTITNTGTVAAYSGINNNASNPTSTVTLISRGSAVTGTVYYDTNADKANNSGDTPLSGATIHLKDANGITIGSTLTDSNGNYSFENLIPGNYSIQLVPPMGYETWVANPGIGASVIDPITLGNIALWAGQSLSGNSFGLIKYGSIVGSIWHDTDFSNNVNGTEGILGLPVTLTDGTRTYTAITKSDGSYTFTGVIPGTYSVSYGYTGTLIPAVANVGDTNGSVVSTQMMSNISIAPDVVSTGYSFTLRAPFDLTINKSVTHPDTNNSDLVVYTINYANTGEFTANNVSIKEYWPANITFTSCTPSPSTTFMYDMSGVMTTGYEFMLPFINPKDTGTITCTGMLDTGYTLGTPVGNKATIASSETEVNTGNNDSSIDTTFTAADVSTTIVENKTTIAGEEYITYTITYTNNGTNSSYDTMGMVTLPSQLDYSGSSLTPTSNISNILTYTLGTLAAGEIKTITVTAKVNATAVVGTSYTTTTAITTSSFDNILTNNTKSLSFLTAPKTGTLQGTIGIDQNRDGINDATNTSVLSGIAVVIRNNNGTIITTVYTDANGNYTWQGVIGDYTVEVLPPAGYWITTQNPTPVTIVQNQVTETGFDGLHQYSVISGSIFDDLDKDGTMNGTETLLSGMLVIIKNGSGSVLRSGTTNGSGMYSTVGYAWQSYSVEVFPSGLYTTVTTTNPMIFTTTPWVTNTWKQGVWYDRTPVVVTTTPSPALPTSNGWGWGSYAAAPVQVTTPTPTVEVAEAVSTGVIVPETVQQPTSIIELVKKEITNLEGTLNLRESGDDGNLLSALPNILPKTGWEQYAILVLLMVILLGGALVWKQE
jgi:uncharacterized repeat protein (TIGR01451 family)/LPXTG-motif cell wall-anchored protein